MNKRRRILDAIKALPDVKRTVVTGEVPLSGGEYLLQVQVYFDDEGDRVPEALGNQVGEGVGTKEKLG